MSLRFFLCLFLAGLSSCISNRPWAENKYLLQDQSIEGAENIPAYEFESLFQQSPNRKLGPTMPYLWFYQVGQSFHKPEKVREKYQKVEDKYDQKILDAERENRIRKVKNLEKKQDRKLDKLQKKIKEGNWLMRAVGEKPVFYDSSKINNTALQMRRYLRNKGFFQAEVKVDTQKFKQRRIKVNYRITENRGTQFGEIKFESPNQRIDSILKAYKGQSMLKTGQAYDADKISAEQQRIGKLLQNQGYLYFSRQYITNWVDTLSFGLPSLDSIQRILPDSIQSWNWREINADSLLVDSLRNYSYGPRRAKVRVSINEPSKGSHKVYHLNKVYFHVVNSGRKVFGENVKISKDLDTLVSPNSRIAYVYEGKKIAYNYRILDRRMRIRPGKLYRQEDVLNTQNSIGILDVYKFVNINPDTSQGALNMHLYTTPMERYQITDEIGFNVVQGLPGPFINVSLKNRNTFRGAELFENSLRFSLDGQTSFAGEGAYSSQEVGFNSSLIFPRVLFPYRLLPKRFRENVDFYNPTTRLNLSFNYVRRPEYTRTNLAASISYKAQVRNSIFNLTLAELSVVNTRDISQEFNEQLEILSEQGNPIIESFDRALVSSIYFTYTYNNNYGNTNKKSSYFRVLLEAGGTTLNLLKQTSLLQENRIFGLKVFQYWRINPTFQYYLPLKKPEHSLAFRINGGISRPYGASNSLPYEKFYFAGGSNSIRAWEPRRLGPGAARPEVNADGTFDYRFEEPGEIILEGNIEYRFPIFGFVKGAVFVDAGNVWSIESDGTDSQGKFEFDRFYRQIALGTGFGFRLNLPFLLLRFDFGIKVYDPARLRDRRWVITQFNPLNPFEKDLMLLNIGIGYPF